MIQNCEINGVGSGNEGSCGIAGQGTFIGNNIYNVENGIALSSGNTLIQDNYIHDLRASGSPHYDGIQIDGGISNVTIQHNTVINSHTQTAALMIDNYFGPISNIKVDNNLLVGGGYTIYSDAHFNGGSITGVSITNNHVGGGYWGPINFNNSSPVYTGNVEDGVTLSQTLNTSGNQAPPLPSLPSAPKIASFSNDSGVAGDGITNDNTLTLTGTAAANSTVKVFDGATQIGTATANSSGAWSFTSAALADGGHSLTAKAMNTAGTSAASAALSVKVDTIAPNAPDMTATSTANNTVILAGSAEANSVVKVFDGSTQIGTAATNSTGAWSFTTGALSGSHAFTSKAMDAAGNTGITSTALAVNIPTSTPTAPAAPNIVSFSNDSGVVGDGITNDNTLTFSGTAVASSSIKVFDGATQIGTATTNSSGAWSFTTAALADGSHSLTAKAINTAGTSAASTVMDVKIDTKAPTLEFTSISQKLDDTVTFRGTAEPFSKISIFDNGQAIGAIKAGSDGSWSHTTTSPVSDTMHSYTAKAGDAAGNIGGSSGSAILGSNTSEVLTSTSGNDLLKGNGGHDTFAFAPNFGADVISDFRAGWRGHDTMQFSKTVFDTFADVLAHATQHGTDVIIDAGGGNNVTLKNTSLSALDKTDFHFV